MRGIAHYLFRARKAVKRQAPCSGCFAELAVEVLGVRRLSRSAPGRDHRRL
jgi:hypothetical protein